MISLSADSLFILDSQGRQVSFDLDAWREALDRAFQACGCHGEAWRTENLILCLEEKARRDAEEGRFLTEEEVTRLLFSLLNSTGFSDVANAFLQQRDSSVNMLPQGQFRRWTLGEASEFLCRRLPLSPAEADSLGTLCLASLSRCGLQECSEEFFQELGLLLLHSTTSARRAGELPASSAAAEPAASPAAWQPEEPPATRYLSRHFWQQQLGQHPRFAACFSCDYLQLLPLSDIFPAARVEFHLDRFCQTELGGWSGELPLLSVLPSQLATCVQLLEAMQSLITSQWPLLSNPPRHLIFRGFAQLFPHQKKRADAFAEELRRLTASQPQIIISCR